MTHTQSQLTETNSTTPYRDRHSSTAPLAAQRSPPGAISVTQPALSFKNDSTPHTRADGADGGIDHASPSEDIGAPPPRPRLSAPPERGTAATFRRGRGGSPDQEAMSGTASCCDNGNPAKFKLANATSARCRFGFVKPTGSKEQRRFVFVVQRRRLHAVRSPPLLQNRMAMPTMLGARCDDAGGKALRSSSLPPRLVSLTAPEL